MTYDILKAESGSQRFQRLTVKLEGCSLTFGSTPCTATGIACFNSWETCRDKASYAKVEKSISFCSAVSNLPTNLTDIPFLLGVQARSGEPDPMRSIGRRGSITAQFRDAPHDDIGIDPYVDNRSYNPMDRGTFWPRLLKRFPYWKNRVVEWEDGYIGDDGLYNAANFKKRTYIIDSLQGRKGSWSLSAKDPFRLADDKLSKMPLPSRGVLAEALTDIASPITLDIETPDNTEYNLKSFEAFSAVRIGKQVFKYTGVTVIAGGVRLTGVTKVLDDGYESEAQSHEIGDQVQKCLWLRALSSIRIVQIALEDFCGISSAWVPYADWLADYTTWQAGFVMTRLITEPEGVKSCIDEIIRQSGTWAYWWDEVGQKFKWSPVRPPDVSEALDALSDRDNLVSDSVERKYQPERLINEYQILFGQRDPTKKLDEVSNYRGGLLVTSPDSQSANENGETKTETIYGRWHLGSSKGDLLSAFTTVIKTTGSIPFTVEFELHRKDDSLDTAEFITLETMQLLDEFGVPEHVRLRILKATSSGQTVSYGAIQDFFRGRFGRIAPVSLDGLLYSAASAAQKSEYVFIAGADGKIDGEDGYELL